MNSNKARRSLIDKVNSDADKRPVLENPYETNAFFNPEREYSYESFNNNDNNFNNIDDIPKPKKKNLFERFKNTRNFFNKIFTSKYEQTKKERYFDNFLKGLFVVLFVGFLASFIIFITSPNQFTKELVYRKDDSIVYDKNNQVIGKISQKRANGENVLNITYDQMNQSIINSVVATEDSQFFSHKGVDIVNTLENGVKTTILRSGNGGGSSITQQIIGQSHVGRIGNSSVTRKIREIYLSFIAETQLDKTTILTSYLNYFEFGQGNIRGVELASNWFYDKSVYQLDYVQASILAGTLNQPSVANPLGTDTEAYGYINNSKERLDNVLLANKNQGYLSDGEYYLLQQVPVQNEVKFNKKTTSNPYQAYIDVVQKELEEKYKIDPFVKSLKIYTNMDTKAQAYANALTKKKHVAVPNNRIDFGFIVSKTQTGEITAVGGGKAYRKSGAYLFNNAISNTQQPGSSFKPIIDYSPTFEYLQWSDRSPISNASFKYDTGQRVYNNDNQVGGIYTMDRALASSRNLTALRALKAVTDKVGYGELTNYLNRFGFNFNDTEVVQAYGLGGLEKGVTPKQMNAAYAAFGNGGYYIEPFTINSFTQEDGTKTVHKDEKERIIDEKTAFMMSTALERSTKISGAYISTANYTKSPYAAKTGTSNWGPEGEQYGIPNRSAKDTWFVGYTSEYTMSSWGGYNTNDIKKGYYPGFGYGTASGHDYSAQLWGAMMNRISNGKEKSYLEMDLPEGIVKKSFNPSVVPPYRIGSQTAYFYATNIPKGYAITKPKKETKEEEKTSLPGSVGLSASIGSVVASFSGGDDYTKVLVVGNRQTSGAGSSLSLSANDYNQVTAYFLKDGKQYRTTSRCYYSGKLYAQCPAKPTPTPDDESSEDITSDDTASNSRNFDFLEIFKIFDIS